MVNSIKQLAVTLSRAKSEDQKSFLALLPGALKITATDVGWNKTAEKSFQFWDNPADEIYDSL